MVPRAKPEHTAIVIQPLMQTTDPLCGVARTVKCRDHLVEGTPEFWLQSWDPGHHELSIKDLRAEAELVEVAEDAARQLAGHFWTRFPEAIRAVQRQAQLKAFDMTRARATSMAREFSDETYREWERFRANGKP